jgi:uncharacterized protein
MQQQYSFKLLPSEAANDAAVKEFIVKTSGYKTENITGWSLLKKSIDARGKTIWVNLTVNAFINEPFEKRKLIHFDFKDVRKADRSAIIIGAGPAGLFAALYLIEKGIRPIILERGKDVRARRRDLATLNKEGIINPESNYCFGEGGAGTYSDGKLYTRSNKRGSIDRILHLFVYFGAEEQILYEAHPHIGTNKLPDIITAMRRKITECGGDFLFESKVVDIIIKDDEIKGVRTASGITFQADDYILATGHSARDIFYLLSDRKILIEAKSFALGVRIEHPQSIIDNIQYHSPERDKLLPPASYSLVEQVEGKGVFSFCMCPGGIIAPAATDNNQVVVNGWSPSKRNNPFANSGIVVQVEENDVKRELSIVNGEKSNMKAESPLALLEFQRMVEQRAFADGGGKFVAPAQRMVDFVENRISASLPECSYHPGLKSSEMMEILPSFIGRRLQEGFKLFGKRMKGYYTNEAVIVGVESRTSSPVRIPRTTDGLHHPQVKNLYPCGEGAGYAGGIVSAAMDGERVAAQITIKVHL